MVKVVIVEDDLMVADINKQYALKTPGIDVIALFNNGKDAVAFIENNKVDLIFLDLYMPNISGLKLLKKIREKKLDTEVIMVTAADDKESLDCALKYGVLDYLIKPFKYERFQSSINKFLNKHNIIQSKNSFTQDEIDKILSKEENNDSLEISKGLQEKTLNLIIDELEKKPDVFFTSEEIGSIIGVSRVTVRRYMNYLIESNKVISIVDYKTGGRPSIKYRYID